MNVPLKQMKRALHNFYKNKQSSLQNPTNTESQDESYSLRLTTVLHPSGKKFLFKNERESFLKDENIIRL